MAKDGVTVDDLMAALAAEKLSPVYLFYGEEDFLAGEAAEAIIRSAMTPGQQGFNLDVMYGGEADARDVVSLASSFPLMADRRVVIVRDFDRLPNKELLSSYLEHPSPTTCLVLHSLKPDFRKKPYVTAKRTAVVVKFDLMREQQVLGWITSRVRQQGREIDAEGAKILAAYVGTSLREVQNELDKLYVYIGERKSIAPDDIRSVVGVSKDFNIFELQNAIGQRNLARSTEILSRMMDAGESPILIIVMLTRYFTLLWKVLELKGKASAEIASTLGINPYFVKEYLAAATNYSAADVEHSFEVLASADEQLKQSALPAENVMQNLLVYLTREDMAALA